MGRIYSVVVDSTSLSTTFDWVELTPADDKAIKLRGFLLSQTSEVSDAAEEGLRIRVFRFTSAVTGGSSGGASFTPVPVDSADAAAGFTAEIRNTTVATSGGTTVVCAELGWNIRSSPLEFWYPDERFCPKVKGAEVMIVRSETTPADAATFMGTFWIEEE